MLSQSHHPFAQTMSTLERLLRSWDGMRYSIGLVKRARVDYLRECLETARIGAVTGRFQAREIFERLYGITMGLDELYQRKPNNAIAPEEDDEEE
jgi:hypothetical protein